MKRKRKIRRQKTKPLPPDVAAGLAALKVAVAGCLICNGTGEVCNVCGEASNACGCISNDDPSTMSPCPECRKGGGT